MATLTTHVAFHVMSIVLVVITHALHLLLHHLGVLIHTILLHGFHHLSINCLIQVVFHRLLFLLTSECLSGLFSTDSAQAGDHFFLFRRVVQGVHEAFVL